MSARLKAFAAFWYDFIVGDDWLLALAVIAGLAVTYALARGGLAAWWLLPLVAALALPVSLWRAARRKKYPGLSAERGEQLLGGRVGLVPPGEPGADVAGEGRSDGEVAYLRAAGQGQAGYQSDAHADADQGADEPVVAGAAGHLGTETAERGQHVDGLADVTPALDPPFVGDVGQAGHGPAGQRGTGGGEDGRAC